MTINRGRVFLGGLVGSVAWFFWSYLAGHFIITDARYAAAQNVGMFLKVPRYPAFIASWYLILLVSSIILAHLYVWSRQTLGPGPGTALKIGFLVGLIAGLPENFANASWSPLSRAFPLGWMVDIWGGCILATLVAGWLYKE